MTYSQLLTVIDSSGLSPEDIAPALGISNMTLRRWRKQPGHKSLPKSYRRTAVEGVYQLIADGKLSFDSKEVQDLVRSSPSLSFDAIIKELGISMDVLNSRETYEDRVIMALSQIGINGKHKEEVDQSAKKLTGFQKLGAEWKRRISMLTDVLRSTQLSPIDKWVAYGALFYLIMPFDLIPDHIPVVGLLDDFGILGFAVAYYARKFPALFG